MGSAKLRKFVSGERRVGSSIIYAEVLRGFAISSTGEGGMSTTSGTTDNRFDAWVRGSSSAAVGNNNKKQGNSSASYARGYKKYDKRTHGDRLAKIKVVVGSHVVDVRLRGHRRRRLLRIDNTDARKGAKIHNLAG